MNIMGEKVIPEEKKKLPAMLYAIRDDDTGELIWNARGYAYKSLNKAMRKIFELRVANREKRYSLVMWRLDDYWLDGVFSTDIVEFTSRKVK